MTLQEAQSLIASYIVKPTSYDSELKKGWCNVKDKMAVHMDGVTPSGLIATRRPHEDTERYNYRLKNYEPITLGIVQEAIDGLYRIFESNNYEIRATNEVEAFIWGNNFNGMDFISYVQTYIIVNMIKDPNSLIAILPSGEGVVEYNTAVTPKIEYVPSKQIIEMNDEYVFYESSEKRLVSYRNRMQYIGRVMYLITKTQVFIAEQQSPYSANNFKISLLYTHDIGEAPYIVLGGIWNNNNGYFDSYFRSFVPFANEAIRQYSDWQAIMVSSAYPIREIRHIDCTNPECVDGILPKYHDARCGTCGGTGKQMAMSPYGVFISEDWNPGTDPSNLDPRPPIRFHSPPTDIINVSKDAWETLYKKAKEALHLEFIQEAQSGTAKSIDREREYAMVLKISNNIFDNIIWKSLFYFQNYINANGSKPPIIVKPTVFSIKNTDDLVAELSQLKQANAPDSLIMQVGRELVVKRYSSDEAALRSNLFLMEIDPLYFYNQSEKLALQASGIATNEMITKNMYYPMILNKIMNDLDNNLDIFNDKLLLKQLLDEQVTKLTQPLAPTVPTQTPTVQSNGVLNFTV